MNSIAKTEQVANAPFAELKALSVSGGPVIVLGAFDAKNFDASVLGLAFEVTPQLIEHINSNMPKPEYDDENELVGEYFAFPFDSRWLTTTDDNEDKERDAPTLKLFGEGNSFWLEEESDDSILVQTRQLRMETLEAILQGTDSPGLYRDEDSGLLFYSEYHQEAQQILERLKETGFAVQ